MLPYLALREQLHHILVETRHRQRVLDAGVAVEDLRLVHVDQRAAFRHDHHLEFASGLDNHLAHVPALLVVALDGERADGFLPPQVRDGVFVALDGRLDRQLGAVEPVPVE